MHVPQRAVAPYGAMTYHKVTGKIRENPDKEDLMPRTDNLYQLPDNLPVPVDDGACNHLSGLAVPALPLPATTGGMVDLASLPGRTVVYAYPRTGDPNEDPPPGWDAIPGARGCTPQSCAFRDHYQELQALGAGV